jgi:hypothetical protein
MFFKRDENILMQYPMPNGLKSQFSRQPSVRDSIYLITRSYSTNTRHYMLSYQTLTLSLTFLRKCKLSTSQSNICYIFHRSRSAFCNFKQLFSFLSKLFFLVIFKSAKVSPVIAANASDIATFCLWCYGCLIIYQFCSSAVSSK